MTDHKFTDDDVIKALECCKMPVGSCACNNCPLDYQRKKRLTRSDKSCTTLMFDYTLALINRQKASLQEVITLNSKLEAENAKLQRLLDFYEETSGNKKAKSEAIKEFAERVKSDLGRIPQHQFTRSQVEWSINTLVKEIMEGGNEKI